MLAGDTPTRKAFFDSLACGCVPVVFEKRSSAYLWHVPPQAVLVVEGNHSLAELLRLVEEMPAGGVEAMRAAGRAALKQIVYGRDKWADAANVIFRHAITASRHS